MKSRVLAHKLVHTLFSSKYCATYKMFDPRPAYNQKPGTAMVQPVYEWFRDILSDLAGDHYRALNHPNRFIWEEMLGKLREVWKWARNNMKKVKTRADKAKAKQKKRKKRAPKDK